MNKHIDPTRDFRTVGQGTKRSDELLLIRANANLCLDKIEHLKTEDEINIPANKEFLIKTFRNFLLACDFYPALADFDELVAFKSGEREFRSDGTYNIFHEFIPMVNVLALVAAGKEGGGIELHSLEHEGGLGVKLQTIINHDNIEDKPLSKDQFQQYQINQTERILSELARVRPGIYADEMRQAWERYNALLVSRNVSVVTRKTIKMDENGQPVILPHGKYLRESEFKNFVAYFRNIIYGPQANITSITAKISDAAHNTSSMTNSEKHSTVKKLAWCNMMENMLGRRQGQAQDIMEKWPTHINEINYWDSNLGTVLYLQFSRLEYVEFAYKGQPDKFQPGDPANEIYPSGLDFYLNRALSIQVPRFASMFHTALDRERKLAETDPQVKIWLERSIYPALANHRKNFPEIFAGPNGWKPQARPLSGGIDFIPEGLVRAPIFL